MAEILEQIKKMSRAEQLALAEQIYALGSEESMVEDNDFVTELHRRADHAIHNPQSGVPWTEVKAQLLAKQREQEQRR